MTTHWTERSIEDYIFSIGADFIGQLEDKMEAEGLSQNDLALRLGKTKGRVSQVFNRPGNLTLGNIVKYSRALSIKASIVAYQDDDPKNKKGPINSEVFRASWEKCGKPRDLWDIQHMVSNSVTVVYTGIAMTAPLIRNQVGYIGVTVITPTPCYINSLPMDPMPLISSESLSAQR